MAFISYIGIIGSVIMALGAIPQLYKTLKDGHAEGLSLGTLFCWFVGMICLLLYVIVFRVNDYILIANYGFNILCVIIYLKYKFLPRKNIVKVESSH